ncbi:flavodoxin [Vibrio sinaloensis]|uniref:flavodoxin n=1 Tax=Photobacterium sp. (strain ATCC 43367) TaxID=379097 RepID=UPI0035EB9BAA
MRTLRVTDKLTENHPPNSDMSESNLSIVDVKNQWLSQHVDVKYPTPESLAGRKLYLDDAKTKHCKPLESVADTQTMYHQDEIYLVDFHRLTVMFALLQSQRWEKQEEQELVVEYLTQIIYSEPCELYVGFKQGEPAAAAIVTQIDGQVLLSDLAVKHQEEAEIQSFTKGLLNKLDVNPNEYSDIYLEF